VPTGRLVSRLGERASWTPPLRCFSVHSARLQPRVQVAAPVLHKAPNLYKRNAVSPVKPPDFERVRANTDVLINQLPEESKKVRASSYSTMRLVTVSEPTDGDGRNVVKLLV
jgi:hypothetical protein